MKSTSNLLLASVASLGLLAGSLPAGATLLVDRGLPTDNLNNAAGADRSNVAWTFTQYTPSDYWLVGDTFQNTSSSTWTINTIRLWSVGNTDTPYLRGGLDGSAIGVVSSTYSMTDILTRTGAPTQGTLWSPSRCIKSISRSISH